MNYEYQILCFYDWLETNSVGPSCIALWHALLHTWRKTGYQAEFAVAISILKIKTGLKKDAIYTARNKLKQLGRIDWEERDGNQSSLYRFIPFQPANINPVSEIQSQTCLVSEFQTQPPTQSPTQTQTQPPNINNNNDHYNFINNNVVNNNVPEKPTQSPTQNKFVSEIQSQTPKTPPCVGISDTHPDTKSLSEQNAFKHFEQKIGLMSGTAIQEMRGFLNDGIETELIIAAIDKAIDNGKYNWAYIKAILDNNFVKGIKTLEAFKQSEQRWKDEKNNHKAGDKYGAYKSNTAESSVSSNRFARVKKRDGGTGEIIN